MFVEFERGGENVVQMVYNFELNGNVPSDSIGFQSIDRFQKKRQNYTVGVRWGKIGQLVELLTCSIVNIKRFNATPTMVCFFQTISLGATLG